MSTAATTSPRQREPELRGQTVVVIGGSAGIGLEMARRAHVEGAKLILTGRRYRHRSSAMNSKIAAISFEPYFPSAGRRAGRCRSARGTHHDEYSTHGRDV